MKRILTAAVFLPIFILIVGFLGPPEFFLLVGAVAVLAVWETNQMARKSGYRCRPILCSLVTLGILYAFLDPRLDPLSAVAMALAIIPVFSLWTREPLRQEVSSLAINLLTPLVLGILLGYLVLLRGTGEAEGRQLIFFLFLVVWTGDTAAYYLGRLLGKHRLAPRISPHKTIEGSVAGAVGSMVAGAVAAGWFLEGLGPVQGMAVGFLLNGFGQVGDLLESILKRSAGVKDSASILPGHGGILDRIDSLVLAGPVLFLCYQFLAP